MPMNKNERDLVEAVGQLWSNALGEQVPSAPSRLTPDQAADCVAELGDGQPLAVARAAQVLHRDYAERSTDLHLALIELDAATERLCDLLGDDPDGCARLLYGIPQDEPVTPYDAARAIDTCIDNYTAPTGRRWSPEEIEYLWEIRAVREAGL